MTDAELRVLALPDGRRSLLLEREGRCFDLSAALRQRGLPPDLVDLLASGALEGERLAELADAAASREVAAPAAVDVPVDPRRVGKALALGKNVRAHAAEFGEDVPDEPLVFAKLPENLVPHGAEVRVPDWVEGRFDHEAELALVLGRDGRDVAEEDAWGLVGGYAVANDLTARSLQGRDRRRGHPWFRAKNVPGAFPLGPCVVPRDALDPSDLRIEARVNGELRQSASTRDFVVSIPRALAYLSRLVPLRAGDLVLMGTPEGVGALEDGDVCVASIEGIGALETRIRRG